MDPIKSILCTIGASLITAILVGQTSIGGIVNNYAVVIDMEACMGEFIVDDINGFEVGDRIFIIQMQGAQILESNDSGFGTIFDLRGCGLYEINEVSEIFGDTIQIANALINAYNLDGKIQLVKIAHYESAVVDSELTAAPWDGNKGGILAIEVDNFLTLNANIILDGLGFRGGDLTTVESNCNPLFNEDAYFYPEGNWRGALKGEGIVPIIEGKELGRGPQATGGGGGNDHNAGGGGGSNASFGGNGGRRTPASLFSCTGDFPGIGGRGFISNSNRCFLGGGGGSGHSDNGNAGSQGGNGGGIAYIKTGEFDSNGHLVSSNGINHNANGDGAGGGGAGGTVVLVTAINSNFTNINIRGADGGNSLSEVNACSGPGGGGGGGRLLTSNPAFLNVDFSAGSPGENINPSSLCDGLSNGATNGVLGEMDIIFEVPQGNQNFVSTTITQQPESSPILCVGSSFTISSQTVGTGLEYQWQVNFGTGNFENLEEASSAYSGQNSPNLTLNSPLLSMNSWELRLLITNSCNDVFFTDVSTLIVESEPIGTISFDNPTSLFTFEFSSNSTNAISFDWDFGDNTESDIANPIHTYNQAGTYTVTLIILGTCGQLILQEEVVVDQLPISQFTSDINQGCPELKVHYQNLSLNLPNTLIWDFEGGAPSNITNDPNPTVFYFNPGTYDVTLITVNDAGSDTLVLEDYITIFDTPTANFDYSVTGTTVNFNNLSQNASTYLWDFGDMEISMQDNPSHFYEDIQTYTVSLTVTNPCGEDTFLLDIIPSMLPTANFQSSQHVGCVPLTVQYQDLSLGSPTSYFWELEGASPPTSTLPNPQVTYSTSGVYQVSLTVTNNAGNDIQSLVDYIQVLDAPNPQFDFTMEDLQLNLINQTPNQENLQFFWNFGDDNTSTENNPTHTYTTQGLYLISLTANNGLCATTSSQSASILVNSSNHFENDQIQIFPNPFNNFIQVKWHNISQNASIEIKSLTGQLLYRQIVSQSMGQVTIPMTRIPSGSYIACLYTANGHYKQLIFK